MVVRNVKCPFSNLTLIFDVSLKVISKIRWNLLKLCQVNSGEILLKIFAVNAFDCSFRSSYQ